MTAAEVYSENHEKLLFLAYKLCKGDWELAEEVCARVWLDFVRRPELILQYNEKLGTWSTYLFQFARNHLLSIRRSELRRKSRESFSHHPLVVMASGDGIEATLTPAELEYFRHEIGTGEAGKWSPENRWQLKRRVFKKVCEFLEIG